MEDRRQKDAFISENTDDTGKPVFELNLCRPMPSKIIKELLSHEGLVLIKAVFRFTDGGTNNDIKKARNWLISEIDDLKDILISKDR
ncbi:MAG: hypothetical protein WC976_07265 [Caldisericia bacterium]